MRPLRPGDPTSVEGYKITGYLGEGGQGSVYAGASADGEPVAIKLLHARFSEDPGALRRFQREADAARRVAEFCTARVLDVGAYGDRPYLVSEFIEGPSLQHHVQTAGPLRGPALVRLAVSTATALAAIHRAGVVHRDFKPSNVLLGPDGPRVIDFGIARALDVSQSVTSSIIGTPAYMAPEQFHGEAYPASDVFAWAGTIVFAATGRGGAFGTGPFPALMHRILALPPDLTGVPGELLQVLGAALDKQPQARPSAENVLSTLLTRTAPPPPPPPPPPSLTYPSRPYPVSTPAPYPLQPTEPRWSRGRVAAVATSAGAAALALVVGTVVWFVNRPPGGTVTPEPTPAALDTRRGGTMRIAMTTSADSADPGDMYTSTAMSMARLYGRSLTMFKPGTTTVVPDLAASLGKTTDGRTWTYTLRAGLKFATGQPISAKDVKYAILRSMDERLPNGSSYFDTQLDLPDGYRGLPADTRPVTAIETPDDRTIVFRLKQPMAEFDYVATLPETIPVPQPADPKTYRANVVSSGPYMFDGAATADHLKLKRNPYWSAQTDPNRPALPDAYDIAANVTDGDDRLINGTSEYGAPIPATQAAKLAPVKDRVDTVTSIVRYLAINPQAGALTNTECRLAVAAALDLDAIRLALGSGDHHGDVPTSLIPPYVPGNHFRTPGHDVEAARAHLTKCGKPKGFSTTFVYRDQPADQALALAVQASLAKVGILVTLKQVDSSTFLGKTGGNPSWLKEQQVGLIPGRWLPDFPTSAGFLAPLVDSRQILENGYSLNVSVRLFAVDKLIDQARAELDRTKRDALWYQIEQQVAESGELVPLLWDRSILLRGKDATNQHVDPVYQGYDLLTMGVRS